MYRLDNDQIWLQQMKYKSNFLECHHIKERTPNILHSIKFGPGLPAMLVFQRTSLLQGTLNRRRVCIAEELMLSVAIMTRMFQSHFRFLWTQKCIPPAAAADPKLHAQLDRAGEDYYIRGPHSCMVTRMKIPSMTLILSLRPIIFLYIYIQ